MEKTLIKSISKHVYQNYPEVEGKEPLIKTQGENTLLIFCSSVKAADGMMIKRTVRVVVNRNGKILKMTTSR